MSESMETTVMRELKTRVEREVLSFMKDNKNEIIAQAKADTVSEVPRVPLFDNYLIDLEEKLVSEFGGVASALVKEYNHTFYYSSLPNLTGAY